MKAVPSKCVLIVVFLDSMNVGITGLSTLAAVLTGRSALQATG